MNKKHREFIKNAGKSELDKAIQRIIDIHYNNTKESYLPENSGLTLRELLNRELKPLFKNKKS